jgi:hypothetical protein
MAPKQKYLIFIFYAHYFWEKNQNFFRFLPGTKIQTKILKTIFIFVKR